MLFLVLNVLSSLYLPRPIHLAWAHPQRCALHPSTSTPAFTHDAALLSRPQGTQRMYDSLVSKAEAGLQLFEMACTSHVFEQPAAAAVPQVREKGAHVHVARDPRRKTMHQEHWEA